MREIFFFLFMMAFGISLVLRLISYIVEEATKLLRKEQSKKNFNSLELNVKLKKFVDDYENERYQKSKDQLYKIEFYSRIAILMSELGIILTSYDFAIKIVFYIHFIWYGINTIKFVKNKKI